jgi:ribosome recycling factor
MDKCLDSAKANFGTIRTGRANPNMLDRIQVEYYGAFTPLRSIAGISIPDATTLQIQPFDTGALKDIERAIMQSDVGITPSNDGKVIRLRIPTLTEVGRTAGAQETP